jgi:flagella basal body P-ring formation protein FlgA
MREGGELMRIRSWFPRAVLIGSCGLVTPALALADGTIQRLDAIERTVRTFLLEQHRDRAEPPQIRLQPLDARLRLAPCGSSLEAFLPSGARTVGNTLVGVRCPGPQTWTVHQNANVQVFDRVMVTGRVLNRGTILRAADLRAERRELSALTSGYETAPERLVGKRLQRALTAGAVIPPNAVRAVPAIRRGETVTLVIESQGMTVSSSGAALDDGYLGQRLRVRNPGSERIIEGVVTGERRVAVGQ